MSITFEHKLKPSKLLVVHDSERILTTLQTEVEKLRPSEISHELDESAPTMPRCYSCNYEEALDDVLAIINKLRGEA